MKKLLLAVSFVAVFAGLSSTAAYALEVNDLLTSFSVTKVNSTTYNFSFTGLSDSGSGVFTVNPTAITPGEFLITGISGTTDGSAIASLYAPGTFPFDLGGGDNDLFFPASVNAPNVGPGFLDLSGVSYALANGKSVNLYYGVFDTGSPEVYNLLFAPASATPEPSSLILLGTGALGLVGAMRRRFAAV